MYRYAVSNVVRLQRFDRLGSMADKIELAIAVIDARRAGILGTGLIEREPWHSINGRVLHGLVGAPCSATKSDQASIEESQENEPSAIARRSGMSSVYKLHLPSLT